MKNLLLILAIICALFGVVTLDLESVKWGSFSIVLYCLPLLSLLSKNKSIRVYACWGGVFLILQTLLSLVFYQRYHHLTPSMKYQLDVQGNGLPGIQGIQNISTDKLGFRATKEIDYTHKSKTLRIFALGASTTEQIYIDDRKTWTDLLQTRLENMTGNPAEVINTGVSGLRMVHVLDNFKKILKLHPDVAIFLMGINDWNKDIINHYDPSVEKLNRFYGFFHLEYYDMTELYLRNSLLGIAAQAFIPRPKLPEAPNFRVEKGDYFTKQSNSLSRTDVRTYQASDLIAEYRTYLEKAVKLCKSHHVRCIFMNQPNAYKPGVDEKTRKNFWMTPPNESYTLDLESLIQIAALYNSRLKDFAQANGQEFCDLDIQIPPSEENFYDEVHFNEKGSELVARAAANCLNAKH